MYLLASSPAAFQLTPAEHFHLIANSHGHLAISLGPTYLTVFATHISIIVIGLPLTTPFPFHLLCQSPDPCFINRKCSRLPSELAMRPASTPCLDEFITLMADSLKVT